MTVYQAIILGIVQGLTEFLPVSSTAHLILLPWLLHWPDFGQTFDVALHAGTLVAVVAYFWSDWMELLTRRRDLLGLVLLASIPGAVVGVLFEHKIERFSEPSQFNDAPLVMAFFLAVAGIWLFWMDQRGKRTRNLDKVDVQDALLIGVSQAFALLPGVSRSGATIGTGLMLGFTREAAARFSFLLSTPIIAGAVFWKGLHWKELHLAAAGGTHSQGMLLLWGVLASAISGLAAIHFLMSWIRKHPYNGFVIYRVALACMIVALWFMRR